MKIAKILLFFVSLIVFECVSAKRISDFICDEITTLNTDPRSLHPHLMELVRIDSGQAYCKATLISENFVLTVTVCAYDYNMRIRKFKLPTEEYPDLRPFFNVKRIFSDRLAVPQAGKHVLALIQLNETVPYHNTRSIYRPACLWTNNFQPVNLHAWNNLIKLNIDSLIIRSTTNRCSPSKMYEVGFNSGVISQSYLCITPTHQLAPLLGGPIEVKHSNDTFIFAVLSYGISNGDTDFTYLAAKIKSFIEWIEPKVWPQLANLKCGQRILKHKPLITFAQPTYHGEYPWHVALYRNNVYSCGGTILNTRTVLTAAHCVQDDDGIVPANILTIAAGKYNLVESPIQSRMFFVQNVIVHENYDRTYLENDIALLKLSGYIVFSEFIQPICISKMLDYSNFTMGSVAGWGRDEFNLPSNVLLQATLPVRDNFDCRDSNRDFFPQYLNDNNFCAGYQNGTNICSGDSGGSMVIEFDSRFFIRGIVSLGVALTNTDRCDITQLVLFTDVPKMYDWIMNHVRDDQ